VSAGTRADLELVRVGCWGGVTKITDPGLVHCNGLYPVEEQAESLAERFPGAVIIASCAIDYNMTYGAWKIIHPDGTGRTASVFRVKHTEDATGNMEEIWLEE
jgi:hypothetical protein